MKVAKFLKETRAEMRHVVWPTRTRAITYSLIVIILSFLVGYLLGGFDTLFRAVLRNILY